jgi:hypothetical protein
MKKTTKTYDHVVELLSENRYSTVSHTTPRDSDQELYVQFLQIHLGANLNTQQIALIRNCNFGSITRTRRKLQEGGQFWGSPEVMAKRRIKANEVQQVAPSESASGLQRRIEEN